MIYKQAIITSLARVFTIAAGLLASILTARYLGPVGRGDYFFVTTLGLLLTQLAQLGLASSNTYLVANDLRLLRSLLNNSLWISLILGLSVVGIAFIAFNILHISFPSGAWILFLLVPASIFYLLGTNLVVGINKILIFNFFQVASNALIVSLLLFTGLAAGNVANFLLASTLGWVIMAIILLFFLFQYTTGLDLCSKSKSISISALKFDLNCFKSGAKYGIKAYVVALIGLFVLRGNVLLLKYFSNGVELGYYSVATQMSDCLAILPSSVGLILFPNLVRNSQNRWEAMEKNLIYVALIMLISCLLTAILAKPFVEMVFGRSFLPAVQVFWWMIPSAFFLGIILIVSQYLAAIGIPMQLLLAWAMAFVIIIFSSWILIPIYAAKGAAISLSVAYFALFGMVWSLANNHQRKECLI